MQGGGTQEEPMLGGGRRVDGMWPPLRQLLWRDEAVWPGGGRQTLDRRGGRQGPGRQLTEAALFGWQFVVTRQGPLRDPQVRVAVVAAMVERKS